MRNARNHTHHTEIHDPRRHVLGFLLDIDSRQSNTEGIFFTNIVFQSLWTHECFEIFGPFAQ